MKIILSKLFNFLKFILMFISFALILMGYIADEYGVRTAILSAILIKIGIIVGSLIILKKKMI